MVTVQRSFSAVTNPVTTVSDRWSAVILSTGMESCALIKENLSEMSQYLSCNEKKYRRSHSPAASSNTSPTLEYFSDISNICGKINFLDCFRWLVLNFRFHCLLINNFLCNSDLILPLNGIQLFSPQHTFLSLSIHFYHFPVV